MARDSRAAHGILPACALDDVCLPREEQLLQTITYNSCLAGDMLPDALTARMKIWIYLSRLNFGVKTGGDPNHSLFAFCTIDAATRLGGLATNSFRALNRTLYQTFGVI